MASVPQLDKYLLDFWKEVCSIAADYDEVTTLDADIKARDRLINVLWTTQRDELLSMVADAQTTADVLIDSVRGLTPRPTLNRAVVAEQEAIYPSTFDAIPPYAAVTNFSYVRESFDDPRTPVLPLPSWWYVGANLYRMVLRSTDYLTTPLEPVSGVNIGVWGASTYYGVIGLQLLNNGTATAHATASAAITQVRSILNETARANRR